MDVEVSVSTQGQQKAPWHIKVAELAGLVAVVWGLAEGHWWLVLAGVGLILASYWVYRRYHQTHQTRQRGNGDGGSGPNDTGDGGGDSGGDGGGGD